MTEYRKQRVQKLIEEAKQYTTFSGLLKNNRKLYNNLHSMGVLREATSHLKRKIRREFKGSYIKTDRLLQTALKFNSAKELRQKDLSVSMLLYRNGVDINEFYDNKDDVNYVKQIDQYLKEINLESIVK